MDCGNRVVERIILGVGKVEVVHVDNVQLKAVVQKGKAYSTSWNKNSGRNAAISNYSLRNKGENTTCSRCGTSTKVKPKLSGPVSQKSSYLSFGPMDFLQKCDSGVVQKLTKVPNPLPGQNWVAVAKCIRIPRHKGNLI